MSQIDLEQIRAQNRIEDVIAETFPLKKTGTHFIGVEHDSFVVFPNTGSYYWYSRSEYGDVFDFVGRYKLSYGVAWNSRDSAIFSRPARDDSMKGPCSSSSDFSEPPSA